MGTPAELEYKRNYYNELYKVSEEYRERHKEYSRRYRETHREEINVRRRAARAASPKVRAKQAVSHKLWVEANRAKWNAYCREYQRERRALLKGSYAQPLLDR